MTEQYSWRAGSAEAFCSAAKMLDARFSSSTAFTDFQRSASLCAWRPASDRRQRARDCNFGRSEISTVGRNKRSALRRSSLKYVVEPGAGLATAIELAERIAGTAPMTNFAAMHVLPRNAEQDSASGLLMEALMSAIAQSDPEAKRRLHDFLEKRASKTVHR